MGNFFNILWKAVNVLLGLLIVVTVLYLYIKNPGVNHGEMLGEGKRDVRPRDVRANAQYPQPIAGQGTLWNGNQQAQFQDPYGAAQVGGDLFDPFGITQMAAGGQNINNFIDPMDLQPMANQPVVNQNNLPAKTAPTTKILQEGHWIGLEVIPLNSTIAMANNIPNNISGVLVDEVTLVSAESGILAGDVITAIGTQEIGDLLSFKKATKGVAESRQATVTVYRNGGLKEILVKAGEPLGFAQMEAAPMILATDRSPHGYYGPCDRCHTISKTAKNTGQLARDAGDVLAVAPPPIKWGVNAPHRDRGVCTNCHSVI